MFAQYGVQARTLRSWADLFIVDVPQNNFVNGGKLSYIHDSPVVSGQDGSGALYRLIAQNAPLADKYRVNYCFQGQPLYISLNANNLGPVEFRDFETSAAYNASLVSYVEGSGPALKSSFYINLERITRDGLRKTYIVGNPSFKRSNISSYRIQKVMIAPRDGSMIFLIEMTTLNGGDTNIRYMVEALRL
jgi:predicted secreted protein